MIHQFSLCLSVLFLCILFSVQNNVYGQECPEQVDSKNNVVRVDGRSLHDTNGPFLGLGVTYMSALYQHKYHHDRFLRDMETLRKSGFNFIRILSMVAWKDREISPCSFQHPQEGHFVQEWVDYDHQLAQMIDIAYDNYNLRVEMTIFADAQVVMPSESQRYAHIDRLLKILGGREHKIIMIEIANEAWQNGFPEKEGIAQLRDMGDYLKKRTDIPIALSAPFSTEKERVQELYLGSEVDVATLHFSRDIRKESGWYPVRECWSRVDWLDMPLCSNEPIGPGASVASEENPTRLVSAALFSWLAGLPIYVFHTSAGVYGEEEFHDMAGINDFSKLLAILPPDTSNWSRFDAAVTDTPLYFYVKLTVEGTISDQTALSHGCLYCPGVFQENHFLLVPMGVFEEGMELYVREQVEFNVYDPSSGSIVLAAQAKNGDKYRLPQGFGAYIIKVTKNVSLKNTECD